MPIFAVNSSLPIKFNGFSVKTNSAMSNVSGNNAQTRPQSNCLIDCNYGSSLIKNSKVSFTSTLPSVTVDLQKKVTAALHLFKSDEIILIGKNFTSAKNALKSSIESIPAVFNKILFIADEGLQSEIAIIKNNKGYEEIVNLGKDGAVQVRADVAHQLYNVNKGERCFIGNGDTILGNGLNFTVANKYSSLYEGINDVQNQFIKQFDLSKFEKGDIARTNARRLEKLGQPKKNETISKITFADIAGQDDAIEEIKETILRPLNYPNFFKDKKTPKSTLFIGPPGNAKTLTAKALANELDIPFYTTNGQLLEGKFVGDSAKNIHEYYENARKNQPCVIFYDEMEAIFGKRTGEHKNAEDSLNMHLDEISQLEKENAQVYLLGATNRPELIDKAALRDGRFGTYITFNNPDLEGCKNILKIHTKTFTIEGLNIDEFAAKLHAENFSGANIAGIAAKAEKNAIKRLGIYEAMDNGTFVDSPDYKLVITCEDFEKAFEKKLKDNELIKDYEDRAKQSRVDEIKTEMTARMEAGKELQKAAPKPVKVGFNRDEN